MAGVKQKACELEEESSDASCSSEELGSQQQEASSDSGSRRSSSVTNELSLTSIKDQLRYCLADVKYVGSFTASQARQRNVDPGLHVNDVGSISLPLRSADAKGIMKAGSQAPFGRGSKTIVDMEFRNTKELDTSQFELRNPAWGQELRDIIAHLGPTLGFQEGTSDIKPELYKLLLYEEGAMFKAHKDSEKAEGMFGTLVICLPSKHAGGSVVLSNHGDTIIFETAVASEFGQSHIAWYSDVTHEIKPVESGYRLVLTYNLVRTGYKGPTSASALVDEKLRFQGILSDWMQRFNAGQPTLSKLAWVLDHKYSEANLGLQKLKGRDDLLGRYVAEICKKEGFVIMFANMTLTVYEAARDLYDDDELEKTLALSKVFDASGRLTIYDAGIKEEEIIQTDCFDRQPDKVEAEETGNEGVDETHFYHDALLLLMPEAFALEFTLTYIQTNDIMSWIRKLIDSLESDPDQGCRNKLIQICKREAKTSYMRRSDLVIACVIEACTALKDVQLLLEVIEGCSALRPGSDVHHAVAQALRVFAFCDVKPSLDELTRFDTKLHLNLIAIDNVRSQYEDLKVENKTLSEISDFKVWVEARIKDVIRRADQLLPEDASQLVVVLKRHGKDMANKHVLPLLKKHKACTVAVISCLANFFEAGRSNEIPQDTAKFIFDEAVHTTISALSFQTLYPKKTQIEPDASNFRGYGYREWRAETEFVERLVSFYCQCLLTHHDNEAVGVLTWLKDEVVTVDIRVFD